LTATDSLWTNYDYPYDSGTNADRQTITMPDSQTTSDRGTQGGVMAGWRYCRSIAITGDAPAGYVHPITVPSSMLSNFANRYDLRDARILEGTCTDTTAGRELPIYVEYIPAATDRTVYAKTVTANTRSLALYYGNSGVPSVSNGNAVFDLFENFDSTPNRWEIGAGTPTRSESVPARDGSGIPTTTLAIAGTRAGSYIRTTQQFTTNTVVEFRAKFTGRSNQAISTVDGLVGFCGDHSMLPLTPHALTTYVTPAGWRPIQGTNAQTTGSGESYTAGSYHVWTITRQAGSVTYQMDRAGVGQTITTNVPNGDTRLYAVVPTTAADPNNPNITLDWITVRRYVAGMNCSVGPETTR
jgi:hypothetical protein